MMGCGQEDCKNENCYSCANGPRLDATAAALMAIEMAKQDTHQLCAGIMVQQPKSLQMSRLKQILAMERRETRIANICECFSSCECLAWSFLKDERIQWATRATSSLDFPAIKQAFEIIKNDDALWPAVAHNLSNLLQVTPTWVHIFPPNRYEVVRVYCILLLYPDLKEPESFDLYIKKIAHGINELTDDQRLVLSDWTKEMDVEQVSRIVVAFQQYITIYVYQFRCIDDDIASATRVLALLYRGNQDRLAYQEFYNDAINELVDFQEDYQRWKDKDRGAFSFCSYPFILEPATKAKILQADASSQMRSEILRSALCRNYMPFSEQPFLILKVRREHLIADTLMQISTRGSELKRPLKVIFHGEEGIDEGGVQKEFFQLIVRKIFDPRYGMFLIDDEHHTVWFNAASLENDREFHLIGIVLGLAIYNGVILDVHFPLAVYKKLMRMQVNFDDLKTSFEDLGRGLQSLLEFDGDVEEVFCRNFQVQVERFGEMENVDLKPNGGDVPVTNDNRKEYVELYTQWMLNTSISRQFEAFAAGFHAVCGGAALQLFRAEELELLICGNPKLDFHALEEVALCEDGYTKDSKIIKEFWQVVHSFSEEQKKKLLFFCTGSDRAPIKGLGNMNFVISRNGPDCDRLPTAHTCFNHLLLPEYVSKEKLRERLLTAINNSEGFGLM